MVDAGVIPDADAVPRLFRPYTCARGAFGALMAKRRKKGKARMPTWSNVILITAIGAVALALFGGFANMIGGGSPERSQKLMRWRVGLQFLALVAIVVILLLRR